MKEKTAIDFLLFSCVGITLDDDKDTIIKQIIKRAYRDASSHVLSVYEKKKDSCYKKAEQCICCFLNNIRNGDFREQHTCAANSLMGIYKGNTAKEHRFTLGIAQKWLNMSVKYLFVVYTILKQYNEGSGFLDYYRKSINDIEQNCDIPIDSFILEAVSRKAENTTIKNALGIKIPAKSGDTMVTFTSGNSLAWSKYDNGLDEWKEDESGNYNSKYHQLQNDIKDQLGKDNKKQVEWENAAWIEVAKKRGRKKQD